MRDSSKLSKAGQLAKSDRQLCRPTKLSDKVAQLCCVTDIGLSTADVAPQQERKATMTDADDTKRWQCLIRERIYLPSQTMKQITVNNTKYIGRLPEKHKPIKPDNVYTTMTDVKVKG